MFDQIILSSALISAVATAFIAVATIGFFMIYLKDKSRSRYDDLHNKAMISEIRTSYESQLRDLTKELMGNEDRWKEMNHLLISSQKTVREVDSKAPTDSTKFLRGMGISQGEMAVNPKLVLVLMPFNSEYDKLYEEISSVCRRSGLDCVRGDEERSQGDILAHIIRLMVKARVIIAEITERNPNVYYELGIAHAMDKSTILIARDLNSVPFDIQSLRIIFYQKLELLRRQLSEALLQVIAARPND